MRRETEEVITVTTYNIGFKTVGFDGCIYYELCTLKNPVYCLQVHNALCRFKVNGVILKI